MELNNYAVDNLINFYNINDVRIERIRQESTQIKIDFYQSLMKKNSKVLLKYLIYFKLGFFYKLRHKQILP